MESSPSTANSGLVFVNFNQDFGCFVAVTSEGFRIFNADPLRQNKTECKSFSALAETVKNDGDNSSVYLGPTITDVVDGKARVVKVTSFSLGILHTSCFIFIELIKPDLDQGQDSITFYHLDTPIIKSSISINLNEKTVNDV